MPVNFNSPQPIRTWRSAALRCPAQISAAASTITAVMAGHSQLPPEKMIVANSLT
jgi:hypothetical protein